MLKPTLFATEPAIVAADLQSTAANQGYLQLKHSGFRSVIQLGASDPVAR
ncbi:MAG: hypothetical protein ACXWTL_07515 [Methylobacter sp.]